MPSSSLGIAPRCPWHHPDPANMPGLNCSFLGLLRESGWGPVLPHPAAPAPRRPHVPVSPSPAAPPHPTAPAFQGSSIPMSLFRVVPTSRCSHVLMSPHRKAPAAPLSPSAPQALPSQRFPPYLLHFPLGFDQCVRQERDGAARYWCNYLR